MNITTETIFNASTVAVIVTSSVQLQEATIWAVANEAVLALRGITLLELDDMYTASDRMTGPVDDRGHQYTAVYQSRR